MGLQKKILPTIYQVRWIQLVGDNTLETLLYLAYEAQYIADLNKIRKKRFITEESDLSPSFKELQAGMHLHVYTHPTDTKSPPRPVATHTQTENAMPLGHPEMQCTRPQHTV